MQESQGTPAEFAGEPPASVEPRVFRAPTVGWGRTEVMVPTGPFEYRNAFGRESSLPRYERGGVLELSRPSFSTLARRSGSVYPDVVLDRVSSDRWDVNTDIGGSPRHDSVGVDELVARAEAYQEKVRIRESKSRDPSTVHEDQSGLGAFEDATQETVNPDAVAYDERLDDLPVFLDDNEIPSIHANDPTRSGPEYCDHCGEHRPWGAPLERGVDALRDGNGRDGNPSYSHCNPNVVNVRSCDCCGCPRCLAKSIRHRKTKEPTWACSNPNCGIEFSHPVERPGEVRDDKTADYRERLYWECVSCSEPTKAPFPGIPEDMLDGVWSE